MEQVHVIAVKSFVNGLVGSVNKKQKLLLPAKVANEFIQMGLVVSANESDANPAKKPQDSNKPTENPQDLSNQNQEAAIDGLAQQSASLQVATASQTSKSKQQSRGRKAKAGK